MLAHTLSLACIAAAARGIERKTRRARSRASCASVVSANTSPNGIPETDIGRRTGARSLADRRLIDFEHAADLLPTPAISLHPCHRNLATPAQTRAAARMLSCRTSRASVDLPEPETPVTTTSLPSGTRTVTLSKVVQRGIPDRQVRPHRVATLRRGTKGCLQRLRQRTARDRYGRALQLLCRARGHDLPAATARSGT